MYIVDEMDTTRMRRVQYGTYFRVRPVSMTALSGGGFDRCPVDKTRLVLFPERGLLASAV